MPHVSSAELDQNLDEKITNQFTDYFLALSKTAEGKQIFNSFFTKTEKIMFAKRLALILMLEKQVPFSHIEQALKMSPTTVARYSVQVEGGKFTHLARWFKTIHNRKIFWQSVEILIR